MADAPRLSAFTIPPASGGKPRQLVVLLHGITHDGSQMAAIVPDLAKQLPDAEFLCLNAPYTYDGGQAIDKPGVGRQWFSVLTEDIKTLWFEVMRTSNLVNDAIDAELKARGLKDENLAIMGFSQGAITAVYSALRRDRPCAALVSYSGKFLGYVPTRSKPWTLVIHGQQDQLVPFATSYGPTIKALQNADVPVWGITPPDMIHQLRPGEVTTAAKFMDFAFMSRKQTPDPGTPGWLPDPIRWAVRIRDLLFGAPKPAPAPVPPLHP